MKKSNHSSIMSSMSLTQSTLNNSESDESSQSSKPVRQGYNKFEDDFIYHPPPSLAAIKEEQKNIHGKAGDFAKVTKDNIETVFYASNLATEEKFQDESSKESENFRGSITRTNGFGASVTSVNSNSNNVPKIHGSSVKSRILQYQKNSETKSDLSMSSRIYRGVDRSSKTTSSLISNWENSIKSKNSTITNSSVDEIEVKVDVKFNK